MVNKTNKEIKKNKSSLKERFIKNSFYNFISSLINRVGALIFTIFLARLLHPEGYGLYSLALSIAMFFLVFTDLGISTTFVKYLSSALKKEKSKINAYYRYILKIKFILTLCASILLIILAYPISYYIYKNSALFFPLLIAALYIFVLSFESFYSGIFYSIEKVKYLTLKEILSQFFKIILAISFIIIVAQPYKVLSVFIALFLASIIPVLFLYYFSKKELPILYIRKEAEIDKKRVRRFAFFLVIAAISSVFFSYIDTLMLGFFVPLKYLGFYRAAFSLVYGIGGILGFFSTILLPVFTKINKKKKEIVMNKIFKFSTIITIPIIILLLTLGKYFLVLFYGYEYLSAAILLYTLSFLIFFTISINIFLSLFSAEEKPEIFAKLVLFSTILNIIFNFIFIKTFLKISPLYATFGASLATTLSWLFYFISILYNLKKLELKINLSLLIKPVIASLIMASILHYSLSFIKDMNLILGFLLIFFGLFVYCLLLFIMKGLKKEDINLIKILFKK